MSLHRTIRQKLVGYQVGAGPAVDQGASQGWTEMLERLGGLLADIFANA